ncbi:MAG: c-type cytochrome [Rhizobiales bacterium]|nr:c-type cytochrome [Hyphomicrobiales bacterium]
MISRLFSKRNLSVLALLAALGLASFWALSAPQPLTAAELPAHTGDVANGERLYNASGCHSCHLPGPDAVGVDAALPAGGAPLKTPVGTFYPPNLTPDPETGLGQWTDLEFVNAVQRGIGKSGGHLIPAFPYTSYAHMTREDVLDIRAYLASLPAVKNPAKPQDVAFQPIVRRGIGLWKRMGLDTAVTAPDPAQSETWNRGRYIVNGAGHCNECHTPRTVIMTSDFSRYLAGGPHPEGEGKVPSLRGLIERGRYKDANDIKLALQNGELLGYDKLSSGGMGKVQSNMAKLPDADVAAIAEYIASLK